MKRVKRKSPVIRVVLIGLLLIVVAIPVLLLFATLPPGERIIKGVLESQLTSQLHQQVSIDVFETNLLSRVQILGLRIADVRDERKPPVLEVGAIKVRYDLPPLLRQELALPSVEIDSVRIAVERDRASHFNVVVLDSAVNSRKPAEKKDTTQSSWKLRLGKFALNGLSLKYHDRALPAAAAIDGLRLSATQGRNDGSYDLFLDTGSGEVQYAKFPATDINARLSGVYSESGLALDSFLVRASDLLLNAKGNIPVEERAPINASIRLTGSPRKLYARLKEPLKLPPLTLTGNIAVDALIAGTRRAPQATVRMDLPAVNVRHAGFSRSLITARWNGDSLAIDTLQVRVFNGAITGAARLAMGDTMKGTGAIAVRGLSLASLYSTLRDTMSPYVGDINGGISATITGNDPTGWNLHSGFTVSRFAHLSDSLADLHLSAQIERQQARLSLVQNQINLQAQVALLPQGQLSGNYSLDVPDMAEAGALLLSGEELSGSLEFRGTIGGTLQSPALNADLRGNEITYRSFPVDRIDARLSYSRDRLVVSEARLSGNLTVDPENPPFGLDSLSGTIAYSGEAQGPVDTLQGVFVVQLDQPAFAGVRVDSARMELSVSGPQLSLTRLDVHRDTLALSVQGSYNLDSSRGNLIANVLSGQGSYQGGSSAAPAGGLIEASFAMPTPKKMQISAAGRGLDLRTLASILLDTARVSGLLDFNMEGGGSPTNPEGKFHLSLREPQYDSLSLDSITSSITLNEGEVNVRAFDIYGPQQRLTASVVAQLQKDSTGKYALLKTSRIEGKVEAKRFDLHSAEAVLSKDAKLSGTASLDLRWNGTVQKPNATGSFDLKDLHLLLNPQIGPVALNLHGSVHGPAVRIDSANGILMNQPFTIKGSVEAEEWNQFKTQIGLTVADSAHLTAVGIVSADHLDLTAQIERLNLSLAQPFLTSVRELGGILDSRVEFKGSMKKPSTSGFLTVRGLRFHPALVDSPFTDGVVRINFSGNSVRVDTVLARAQYGTAFVSGDISLGEGGISAANVSAVVNHLPVSSEDNFDVRIDSAGILFQGEQGDFTLGGDIILGESRITRDLDVTSFVGRQSVQRASSGKPGLTEQTRLDLRIRGTDSLWVDNNLANLRLHVELVIMGRPSNPILTGQLSIPEGEIFYLDREFEVKEGTFLFSDPNKINPEVNLRAETEVTSYEGIESTIYTVIFSAQGLLSELETNLSAQPQLDNSDIVSLLTLGVTRTQMTQGGSAGGGGTGAVLEERAEQLASQKISGVISKKAGKALGLDEVTVSGNLFNFSDSWGPQLVISKRISPRAKVTYSTNVGHINDQSFRLSYQLTPRWSVAGETDEQGNSTLSVFYGLQFP